MFPDQIQLMEEAKQVIPSRIWPQVFDDVLVDLGKPLYVFMGTALRVEKLRVAYPNGEMRTSRLGVAVACGELRRQGDQGCSGYYG